MNSDENYGNNTFRNKVKEKFSGGVIFMQRGKYKAMLIVCGTALVMGIISFAVTVKVYDTNYEKEVKNDNKRSEFAQNNFEEKENLLVKDNQSDVEIKNEEIEVISDEAATTTDEYLGEDIEVMEISEDEYLAFLKDVVGDDTILVGELENNDKKIETNAEINGDEVIPTIANIEKSKLDFIKPVEGEIGMNYATEKLVYSNTLEEWITHNGVDILGEEAMPVKAIESGVIESVKMDPRYGNTIIIKHNDEYKSVYSNLSTTELAYVGKKVEKGEIIAGIGKGFGFESKEKPHIHLEILKKR